MSTKEDELSSLRSQVATLTQLLVLSGINPSATTEKEA